MVPNNTNSTVSYSSWQWNSPLPYLFGSLGIMVALITMALIILACSIHKQLSNTSSSDMEHEKQINIENDSVNNSVPQILVIMAGDDNPTHLAIPVDSLPDNRHHVRSSSPPSSSSTVVDV